jgi:DNA-directed RNA polymerase specialized sigma24 family protein
MSAKKDLEQLKQLGYTLHQLLLEGDPTATAQIAEAFMPWMIEQLGHRYSNLRDPHLIDTAVADALINYFGRPDQYDPARGSLAIYLRMSANGDLLNLLKRSRKETSSQRSGQIVELDDPNVEHEVEIQAEFDLEAWVLSQQSPVWEWLPRLLPDPIDQEILSLMLEGVRETEPYAEVLGLSAKLADEQAVIVKRSKDRLKKKLQRNLKRSELSVYD